MFNDILIEKLNVKLTPFSKTGATGMADSIEAVQKASGLIRLPPYGLVIARDVAPENNALWDSWYDLDEEQVRVRAKKSYKGINQGEHRLFLVGCSSFSHDTDALRALVKERDRRDKIAGFTDNNFCVPLSQEGQVDRLLGDKVVYVTGADGNSEEATVDMIKTCEQFMEAQQDKDFLANNPFYVVKFPETEIRAFRGGYFPIGSSEVRDDPTCTVRSGGVTNWQVMLGHGEDKGYRDFYVDNPFMDYNSGGGGSLDCANAGFNSHPVRNKGCSLGVMPETLDALVQASRDLTVKERPNPTLGIEPAYTGIVKAGADTLSEKFL